MFQGALTKMTAQLGESVLYQLGGVPLNPLLGQRISLDFLGDIFCIQCDKKTSRSFQGGFCFPCFKRLQDCGLCMIHPERCRHPEGICDPDDWVHAGCGSPHVVYLSNTAHVKVGITRKTQVPTRWIDQGAVQAIPIFETSNRYLAGQMEVALKQFFPDKTPWQAMLKNQVQHQNLVEIREQFLTEQKESLNQIMNQWEQAAVMASCEDSITHISYPVLEYPTVVRALNFDKTSKIEGVLLGIKGQYLILDTGVLNIRKFGGYSVEVVAG